MADVAPSNQDVDPSVAQAVGTAFLRAAASAQAAGSEELKAMVQTHNAGVPALESGHTPIDPDQVQAPERLSADQLAHHDAHPEDFQLHNAGRPAVPSTGGHSATLPMSQPFAVGDEPRWFREAAKRRELETGVAPDVAYAELLSETYRLENGRWYGPSD